MSLCLSFNKRKQNIEPEIIVIEHAGEALFIKVSEREANNNMIKVVFEGPKTFKIDRVKTMPKEEK